MRFPVVTSSKPALQISCMQSHYRTRPLCRVSETLSKTHIALDKGFAECGTRQTLHGDSCDSEEGFAECFFSNTR